MRILIAHSWLLGTSQISEFVKIELKSRRLIYVVIVNGRAYCVADWHSHISVRLLVYCSFYEFRHCEGLK